MAIQVRSQAWLDLMSNLPAEQRYMLAFLVTEGAHGQSTLNSVTRVGGDYRGVARFLKEQERAGHLRRINWAYYEPSDAGRRYFNECVGHLLRNVSR